MAEVAKLHVRLITEGFLNELTTMKIKHVPFDILVEQACLQNTSDSGKIYQDGTVGETVHRWLI